MTVVRLEAARNKRPPEFSYCWQPEETAELMRLYSLLVEHSNAKEYEYGETENHEPQFYILGPALAHDCLICVSRILKDGRTWYVVENGLGDLAAEGHKLSTLVIRAMGSWRSLKTKLLIPMSLLWDALMMGQSLLEESFSLSSIAWLAFA